MHARSDALVGATRPCAWLRLCVQCGASAIFISTSSFSIRFFDSHYYVAMLPNLSRGVDLLAASRPWPFAVLGLVRSSSLLYLIHTDLPYCRLLRVSCMASHLDYRFAKSFKIS